ncbi:hypothetical protein L198_01635 [Cryptococcus wingfieldii CBS 7118]|uniref:Uncharacterized protein n=1 Tax=Cryptococcus wingfieldii CBS 7118 TaxID=1295528 RepID=A0A1E3K054_9TREE|nr:hypothetical protein L198_01635 [Cryptococcus wingfieldii CBS 7118]ODO06403.1 hypothetical protein L198_01635 [Cryptococcus wingfieldii CBS 7118]
MARPDPYYNIPVSGCASSAELAAQFETKRSLAGSHLQRTEMVVDPGAVGRGIEVATGYPRPLPSNSCGALSSPRHSATPHSPAPLRCELSVALETVLHRARGFKVDDRGS